MVWNRLMSRRRRGGSADAIPGDAAGSLLMVALAWSLWASSTPVTAAPKDAIRAFVERVNEASVGFFSSGSEADARERCRALLAWAFDVPAMGKEALGRAWDKTTEGERAGFLRACGGGASRAP